jgi:uncharacterized protein YjbJ (UPF0337 family)
MSMGDKIEHQAEEAKGRVKKNVGDATDDPEMEAEGRKETLAAEAKQAGDKVKDRAEDVGDRVKDAAEDVGDKGEDMVDKMRDRNR